MKETIISVSDLRSLPEYSCSLPSGTTIGRRWRRDTTFNRRRVTGQQIPKEWMIGEYVPHHEPGTVGINWTWAVREPGVPYRGEIE